jgi:3',5'-cyclic-nucleotide phosphodiesterase
MESDLGIPSSLVAPPDTESMLALAKSQVGFMTLFALPLFESLSQVLPEMRFSVEVLRANKAKWTAKIETMSAASIEIMNPMCDGIRRLSTDTSVKQASADSEACSDHGTHVLGPVVMETSSTAFPSSGTSGVGSDGRSHGNSHHSSLGSSRIDSPPRSVLALQQKAQTSTEQPTVAIVVTKPYPLSAPTSNGHATTPLDEKRPMHQHSSEHLSAQETSPEKDIPDRPRSSPPDLGDRSSEHSCAKGCAGTTTIVTAGPIQRRPSRFFRKVRLWKSWRKEASEA